MECAKVYILTGVLLIVVVGGAKPPITHIALVAILAAAFGGVYALGARRRDAWKPLHAQSGSWR